MAAPAAGGHAAAASKEVQPPSPPAAGGAAALDWWSPTAWAALAALLDVEGGFEGENCALATWLLERLAKRSGSCCGGDGT
jgi:hypothetical protein